MSNVPQSRRGRYDSSMSFISILLALLLEQARPLAPGNAAHNSMRNWVRWVMRNCDAGKTRHAWLAWLLACAGPAVLACAVHWVLVWTLGWAVAVAWNVAMLYCTLGFRQFSHHFTEIRDALLAGDEELARSHLARWMHMDASELPRSEIVRHVIEHSVLSAHRHVFGVLAWYSVLAGLGLGPAGAVLYRLGEYVGRYACRHAAMAGDPLTEPKIEIVSEAVKSNALRAWFVLDWVPARLTALGFAFVGSFEVAVDSWRRQETQFPGDNDGVILAATAGALNIKLGPQEREGDGRIPQIVHLRATVGLLWRTVVMWMVILALLSMARLLG